jgi:Tfp pilus assembly protein PilO
MNKLKQWIAFTVVGVVAVLAAGWFLLVAPRHAEAAGLRQQTAEQEGANGQLRTALAVLKAQATDLPKEQAKLALVAAKLPDNPAEPELLRALAAAADTAGVELVSIAPGALTPVTPVAAPTTPAVASKTPAAAAPGTVAVPPAPAAAASSAGTLMAMPVTISVAGGYYEVEQYLTALEDLTRAFRVTSLAVTPGANPVAPVATGGGTPAPMSIEDGKHLITNITGMVYVAAANSPLTPVVAPVAAPAK